MYAMSRQSEEKCAQSYPDIAKFHNVKFVQGDCLKLESYPNEIK